MRQAAVLLIGLLLGILAFIIASFFIPRYVALLFGTLITALYILIISILENRSIDRYVGDEEEIGRPVLLKCFAYYYNPDFVCKGMLYLTRDTLIFISHESKETFREDMPINQMFDLSYGDWHPAGIRIVMSDGAKNGYIGNTVSEIFDKISEVISLTANVVAFLGHELDCEYDIIRNEPDIAVIMQTYKELLVQGREEGFTPIIIVPDTRLCDALEDEVERYDIVAHREAIIQTEAPEIDAAELLLSRIHESRPAEEGVDIVGEFIPCEPTNAFYSLIDPETELPRVTLVVAKIPTLNPWEVAAWIPMGGFNYCPSPAEQTAVFSYWNEKFGAIPAVVHGNIWEMYVENPADTDETAAALAMEHFGFCSDMVLKQMTKINVLASTLVNSHVWFFYWDLD